MDETRLERLCIDKGMKMTEQRRIIARVLSASEDHPDVEEVYRRASVQDSKISIATVYRTMRLFEDAGIVERHDFGDGRARYEEATDEHHDYCARERRRLTRDPMLIMFRRQRQRRQIFSERQRVLLRDPSGR